MGRVFEHLNVLFSEIPPFLAERNWPVLEEAKERCVTNPGLFSPVEIA